MDDISDYHKLKILKPCWWVFPVVSDDPSISYLLNVGNALCGTHPSSATKIKVAD